MSSTASMTPPGLPGDKEAIDAIQKIMHSYSLHGVLHSLFSG